MKRTKAKRPCSPGYSPMLHYSKRKQGDAVGYLAYFSFFWRICNIHWRKGSRNCHRQMRVVSFFYVFFSDCTIHLWWLWWWPWCYGGRGGEASPPPPSKAATQIPPAHSKVSGTPPSPNRQWKMVLAVDGFPFTNKECNLLSTSVKNRPRQTNNYMHPSSLSLSLALCLSLSLFPPPLSLFPQPSSCFSPSPPC